MRADLSDKQGFLREMAERVTLREGAQGVENVMRALFEAYNKPGPEPLSERVLARITRLPVPVVSALCKELGDAGVLNPGMPLRLDEAAVRTLSEKWGWAARAGRERDDVQLTCEACEGTGVAPAGGEWVAVLAGLRRHNVGKAPETLMRMVALAHAWGALAGRDVFAMGADGALAVAAALAGKSLARGDRLARRVVAADPHERNLIHLRDAAVAEGVLIGLVRHEPHRPLPDDLRREFDTVLLSSGGDVGETVSLVRRSVDAAREGALIFLLLSRTPEREERRDLQEEMLEQGLAFEQVVPLFDRHPGMEADLYVLRVVGDD